MDMITVKEAAKKWDVTPRYVQMACKNGTIPGVTQWGRAWMIPADAVRPGTQNGHPSKDVMSIPRQTPFLDMTDLYHTPGCAKEAAETLAGDSDARLLFDAEIAYARGESDRVYEQTSYLLHSHSGFYSVLAGGMLLGFCAIWRGDLSLWNRAKAHVCEAPIQSERDREIVSLTLAALNCAVSDMYSFPKWFEMGDFELLHPDALPAAKVFYARYLYVAAYAVATKQHALEGVQGISLMSMLPNTFEPMICQAMADKTVLAELCLRLTCAQAYHNSHNDERAIYHIDRAIAIARPDGLWGVLVEHRRHLDNLLDQRLTLLAPEALDTFRALHKSYSKGWASLSGTIRNRKLSTNLTMREREVGKLAAFGMSNAEIAEALHISVASVKQAIRLACTKGKVEKRSDLITIL